MSIKAGRRFVAGNSVNTRADVNLSNITPQASEVIVENVITSDNPELNKADISKYATNCITEIPQRIKYTLVDGTLTIKAGSVVIVPYGTEDLTDQYPIGSMFINDKFEVYDTQFEDGKFFVWAKINEDFSRSVWGAGSGANFIFPQFTPSSSVFGFGYTSVSVVFSGSTVPSVTNNVNYWYDTSNNIIKITTNAGATWDYDGLPAFPIFIGDLSSGKITSINQIFNGMGYIGSTIWVDKGVKGLIPNGRNADGTLNNIEFTTGRIDTVTMAGTRSAVMGINTTGDILYHNIIDFKFDEELNIIFVPTTGVRYLECIFGSHEINNGVISNFQPKLPFRALDINDASSVSLPSTRYVDLSLGAAKTTYTAPANGYIALSCIVTGGGLFITHLTNGISTGEGSITANTGKHLYLPVCKGDKFLIDYTGVKSVECFRFIYAEGEV